MTSTWTAPKYFEDLEIGQHFVTAARTITECDIVHFFMLSGAFEELFTNREFVEKESVFKKRIGQGPLTLLISLGLGAQQGWMHGMVMAFLGMDQLRVPRPVYENDTVHVDIEIIDKRESRSRTDGAIVTSRNTVLNQHGQPVMTYSHTILIRRRPTE